MSQLFIFGILILGTNAWDCSDMTWACPKAQGYQDKTEPPRLKVLAKLDGNPKDSKKTQLCCEFDCALWQAAGGCGYAIDLAAPVDKDLKSYNDYQGDKGKMFKNCCKKKTCGDFCADVTAQGKYHKVNDKKAKYTCDDVDKYGCNFGKQSDKDYLHHCCKPFCCGFQPAQSGHCCGGQTWVDAEANVLKQYKKKPGTNCGVTSCCHVSPTSDGRPHITWWIQGAKYQEHRRCEDGKKFAAWGAGAACSAKAIAAKVDDKDTVAGAQAAVSKSAPKPVAGHEPLIDIMLLGVGSVMLALVCRFCCLKTCCEKSREEEQPFLLEDEI